MTTFNIPKSPPKPPSTPKLDHPDQGPITGDQPVPRETTASKKVDDISKHESKHVEVPKQAPAPYMRDKAPQGPNHGTQQPQGGKPAPGPVKK